MATSEMYRTERRRHGATWVESEFGLLVLGEQAPYMSLTGVEFSHPRSRHDRYWLSCGQIREQVLGAFPELKPIARWHLCTDGEPMHYIANARFWHEGVHGQRKLSDYEPDMRAAFANTIALGALDTDPGPDDVLALPWEQVLTFLEIRLPAMREAFRGVVASLPSLATATNATRIAP